jgi:hypothetical protein
MKTPLMRLSAATTRRRCGSFRFPFSLLAVDCICRYNLGLRRDRGVQATRSICGGDAGVMRAQP